MAERKATRSVPWAIEALDWHDSTASLELAFSVAQKGFRLKPEAAREVAAEVAAATGQWRNIAREFALEESEIDRVAPAFEHRDLDQARRGLTFAA